MAEKQPVRINFSQGLDQKSDPKQIPFGKFFALNNSIFTKAGLLAKRNGYGTLQGAPANNTTNLTTFGGNLTALGNNLSAYSNGSQNYIAKGVFQPIAFAQLPAVRSALSQVQCDSTVAANGLSCTVYSETNNGTIAASYLIQDSVTGQNIIPPTPIPVTSGVVTGSPRVFVLGAYFMILFTNVIAAASHLQYIAVSSNSPTVVTTNQDLAPLYTSAPTLSWDAVTYGQNLYFAYNTAAGGQQVAISYINTAFSIAASATFAGSAATAMSVCVDSTISLSPVIYAAFWDSGGSTGHAVAVDKNLTPLMNATQWLGAGSVNNVAATARAGVLTIAYENANNYGYDSIPSNFISQNTVTLPLTLTTGTVGTAAVVLRSVGLASKGFLINSKMYMLAAYSSPIQPTYFLIDLSGNVLSKFAYENGGGYLGLGLPSAQVSGSSVKIAYLFKDLIQSVNKTQGLPSAAGIYSQTGVNVATFTFNASATVTEEVGKNLNISGGMLYAYDGNVLNEQNFHLFPDSVEVSVSHSGGFMTTQDYFVAAMYQWTDAQGNIINSPTSIPVLVPSASFSGSSNSMTVHVPTCRITYKPNVKIIIFRWSTGQQTYYQTTSISAPLLNNPAVDSVDFVDTLADSSIVGNSIIYTNGGVLDNVAPPPCNSATVFDTRLWIINAEDTDQLWPSKPLNESTPVEFSLQQTYFISPTTGTTNSTGPTLCIFPMDDKLIIFKKDNLFYINGTGPTINGLNSQYSPPILIPGTVGSANQASIVLVPAGLMFSSDKGIWLLGHDLSVIYIGAPVENSNGAKITSAVVVPGTTQVRFTLNNRTFLMYDYFYGQWGTFIGLDAVSSCIFNGLHTFVTSQGIVCQETPGVYLDAGNPVLLSFTTGWLNMAGLRGYERFYEFYLLGTYLSPHLLQVTIGYDYTSAILQTTQIQPLNFGNVFGGISPFGGGVFGGVDGGNIEQWRIHARKQKCSAFQITINEFYDPSFGMPAGAGLSLSGLDIIAGVKKAWAPIRGSMSAG